jgi:hypothetical protein
VPVELWLALVFMAVAFAGGFLIRGMSDSEPAQPVIGSVQGTGVGQNVVQAPPLSSDQLSGSLPAGHPDIGDSTVPSEPGAGNGGGGGGNGGGGGGGGGNGS